MKNRNGYIDSIMTQNPGRCALCGASEGFCYAPSPDGERSKQMFYNKLDRHEPWGGANRQKSKALGLWVPLCHLGCHEGPGSVHADAALARQFRKDAQRAAMLHYGWTREQFIQVLGKSELSADEAARIIPKNAGRDYIPACKEKRTASADQSDGGFRILEDLEPLPF